jgi:hypothetical protein
MNGSEEITIRALNRKDTKITELQKSLVSAKELLKEWKKCLHCIGDPDKLEIRTDKFLKEN